MTYKAVHRFARIAPRKARLVAALIRGRQVDEALTQLDLSKKRGAWYLKYVLKSASPMRRRTTLTVGTCT